MSVSSPYKGLARFEDSEQDAQFFFGRERDAEIVVANLIASRLTVLYGPSGVGKSSLLLASVARSLRGLPEAPLVVTFSAWGEDPGRALATAISELSGIGGGDLMDVAERAQLENDIYVVFDQAEEYFTYHDDVDALETVLAELVNSPLRVNVLVSLREDTLAALDRLKGRVPHLFGNVLRLDRLDRAAGRAAIVRPLERWNDLTGEHVRAEERLIDSVLDGVGADLGSPGTHARLLNGGRRIEAPYLQLVMERVWDEERAMGSETLQSDTLDRLGGPRRIVADHLDRAMRDLDESERDVAATMFAYLVTPSGTKIAHEASDLAEYVAVSSTALLRVLDALVAGRILRRDEGGRYEIFHDVLAAEVLDWRRRHQTERILEDERRAGRRRQRRLGLIATIALTGVAITAGLAVWALAERDNAQEQAAAAESAETDAEQQAAIAERSRRRAELEAAAASKARKEADNEAAAARRSEQEAEAARVEAQANAQAAEDAKQQGFEQAAVAERERDRADEQAAVARSATERAVAEAAAAQSARAVAEREQANAVRARQSAEDSATVARAREKVAEARALLQSNPEAALQAALAALEIDPRAPVESVLREGLLRSRSVDIMPGGGGEVVAAFPDASAVTEQSTRSVNAIGPEDALVSVTRNGVVRVFDRARGTLRRSLTTGAAVSSAALAPDRRTIALGGPDGRVRLYSLTTGKLLRSIDHVGGVLSVAYSPDGRLVVSTGTNETAKIWDAGTGELVHRFAHPRAVRSASFSPDGTRLATVSSDRFVRLFDVQAGSQIARLDQIEVPTAAVFSPNGRRIVTTGQDELPHVWDTETGKLVTVLQGHSGNVLAAAFNPVGDRIATASTDGTARVWEAETGRLVLQLTGHTGFVEAVSYSPDGRQLLTSSRDGTARIWNALSGAEQAPLLGHRGRVTSVAFAPDGRSAVTAGEDGTTRTWSLRAEPELREIASGPSAIRSIAVSGKGTIAEARADGTVNVRNADGRLIAGVRLAAPATDVGLSRDGTRLLATDEVGTVGIWAIPGAVPVARFEHGAPVTSGAFLTDGSVVSGGRDGTIRAWDVRAGRGRLVAREPGPVLAIAASPDGRLVATAVGDVARVRALTGGTPTIFEGHRDALTSVTFSPNGRRLATTSFDHDVLLWDVLTGRRVKSFVGHVAVVRDAAFSPDGRWVASAGPTRAGLWEAGASSLLDSKLYYLTGHRGAINSVAFGSTRWVVYSGGVDGTLRRYRCTLCAGTDVLTRLASAKLRRLAAEAKR